ncbi:2-hydroxychromene-2-carboxylate isomerase [Sphingomonas canadensis]|uniref:2-hydroxychromene-2-carboxylate isomerase n=1 Tax=Sphingomonas canadensis TaxID=1219257 RepID=A0ABW3H464_9SPHN|nr:2-hydroxychromene-2-carboxylate isomerase [Sphingomonas canadensis]MCW3834458.1 2-hydroxychromene-2-carboxylate isomerase [Sphingomonas canadensis]
MKLELFFDCSSPWAYLGFEEAQPLAEELGLDLVFRPVLVGGVFNAVNTSVYHVREKVPAKAAWVGKDLRDWARLTGHEIHFPPAVFPVNSAKAMRACLLLEERGALIAFARAAFEAYWSRGADISQERVLEGICRSVGIDADSVVPRLGDTDLKDRLRANTDELIARGGFGVPTFFLKRSDMYFGVDRLPMVREAVRRARAG